MRKNENKNEGNCFVHKERLVISLSERDFFMKQKLWNHIFFLYDNNVDDNDCEKKEGCCSVAQVEFVGYIECLLKENFENNGKGYTEKRVKEKKMMLERKDGSAGVTEHHCIIRNGVLMTKMRHWGWRINLIAANNAMLKLCVGRRMGKNAEDYREAI